MENNNKILYSVKNVGQTLIFKLNNKVNVSGFTKFES